MKLSSVVVAISAALALSGCATLAPNATDVAPGIPAQWPAVQDQTPPADAADLGWRTFFPDPRLQQVIAQARDDFTGHAVSTRVNSAQNDDEGLIEAIAEPGP